MNAIEMLTKQHREMEASLKTILEETDGRSRRALFDKVADVLMSHVLVEETLFYPAVTAKRTEDVLLESLEEHLSLKRIVADLLALSAADETFEAKLHVLKEQAAHHHEEEEEKLFPNVKKILSEAELDTLGESMGVAQAKVLQGQPRNRAAGQTDAASSLRS